MANELPALYKLGIVGAGQIARMTHQAAVKLGITPRLLAEDLGDSAALAAPDAVFSHPDALAAFAESCEVITFEHERLDLGLLQRLEDAGVLIRPGTKTVRAAFDKMHQRRVLLNRGLPVPVFTELRGPDDVLDFATVYGWPLVIKSVRAGTRNQVGVWIVESQGEALRVMAEQNGRQLMIEDYKSIVKELVVLVVRRPGGSARCYPVVEVVNTDGICREIRAPAAIGHRVATEARELALKLADEFDAVGVLAVELFLTTEGLVINELAARPHNAGHVTIEGAATSQFENHVRAVLDLPLGPTWATSPAVVTINVIGGMDLVDPAHHLSEALSVDGVHVHLYGKEPRVGSKLGHVTALGDDLEHARDLARRAEAALHGRRAW
ncbi:MAG: 5-(carboxyamino)imidazole ribonucleotide synthase [Acidimicrobiales bacterium]